MKFGSMRYIWRSQDFTCFHCPWTTNKIRMLETTQSEELNFNQMYAQLLKCTIFSKISAQNYKWLYLPNYECLKCFYEMFILLIRIDSVRSWFDNWKFYVRNISINMKLCENVRPNLRPSMKMVTRLKYKYSLAKNILFTTISK